MNSKKQMEKELQTVKSQLKQLSNSSIEKMRELAVEKAKADETGADFKTLLKYMMDQDKKNQLILKAISERLERLEENLDADYEEQEDPTTSYLPYQKENNDKPKVQPISGLDAQIMQIVQRNEMACADDIRKQMSYKGRNAASARLNRLYKAGLLERYQLGHKVYYKYDSGTTANTLIVSPPQ